MLSRNTAQSAADMQLATSGTATVYAACPATVVPAGYTGFGGSGPWEIVPHINSGISPTINLCGVGPLGMQWSVNGTYTDITTNNLKLGVHYQGYMDTLTNPPTKMWIQPNDAAVAGAGTGNAPNTVSTTFSATPAFNCGSAIGATITYFTLSTTLTANIAPTITNCTPGQIINLHLVQDATGGRTFTAMTNFDVATIDPRANAATDLHYVFDGTNGHLESLAPKGTSYLLQLAPMIAAPVIATSCPAGFGCAWFDLTQLAPTFAVNGNTTRFVAPLIKAARTANQFLTNIDATGTQNPAAIVAGDLPTTLTSGTSIPNASLGTGYLSTTKTAAAAGVTANLLVKIDSTGNVVNAATADVGILGIAATTATSGNPVEVATRGIINCIADNTTVIGNVALVGTNTAGRCLDSGQTNTTLIANNLQVIGKILTVATVGNPVSIQLYGPGHYGAQVVNAGILNGTIDLTTKVTGALPSANMAAALASQTSINGVTMGSAVGDATITQTIAHGATAMATGALAANTCASTTTVAATGVATTDVILPTANADLNALVGYGILSTDGLKVSFWPTSGNVNFRVCNGTGASITVPGMTLNWKVIR